jgi:SlyX protein
MNETIMDLQTRLAFQEESLEAINLTVVRQQSEIDMMQREIIRLKEMIDDIREANSSESNTDEVPPHY